MSANVPGVCCKQEIICLLSARNGPFPTCVTGAQGESSEVNAPFPETVLLWKKSTPSKATPVVVPFFCFPPVGRSWDQVERRGGRGRLPIVPVLVHCSPPLHQTKVCMSTTES